MLPRSIRAIPMTLVAFLSLAGCRHDADPAAWDALLDDPVTIDAALYAAGEGDVALAGRFGSDDTLLELYPDGRYRLLDASAGDGHASRGEWSLEPGSGQLLLEPHLADAPRLRYSMPSGDELVPEDGGPRLLRAPLVARHVD